MNRDILTLRRGECKFCVTADTPFFFCGEPVAEGSVYCAPHHAICYAGHGRDIGALEAMMYALDGNITRKTPERGNTEPVDVVVRG